jgi:D-tyrosyl-tRNA(Tyr) deacylase
MRAVVQRVSRASVTVDGELVGAIGHGLCVLVGVGVDDDERAAESLAAKVRGLRLFEDDAGKMNRDVVEVGGALLAISQFTLFGDVRKGKRPSFSTAMEPERALVLFELFCAAARREGLLVETGRFRADMKVELVNEGPVTLLVDTSRLF